MNVPILQKSCNGCTACCSGTLAGSAYGHPFWKGRPCYFCTSTGCAIYAERPKDPCRDYVCAYLQEDWVPEWMRPENSGVIMTRRTTPLGIPYLEVLEYNKSLSAEVLSFLFMSYLHGHFKNLSYQLNGGTNRIGEQEFIKEFQ